MIKQLLKRLVEKEASAAASWTRYYLFLRQAHRDSKFTSKVARALGLRELDANQPLFPNKNRDTIFILAGGASVNRLSAGQFDIINSAASIGINFWPIHSFVPTALSNEVDNDEGGPDLAARFLRKRTIEYGLLPQSSPLILLLRPAWPPNPSRIYSIKGGSKKLTYVYGRANVITRKTKNLDSDLKRIVRRAEKNRLSPNILPDNGSSVVRLTFLALMQGFKKIVWVGVDQDGGPYFWTEEPIPETYREAATKFPRKSGEPHSTSNSEKRPFSNDSFLRSLARVISRFSQSEIFVSHSASKLSDTIPVYPWPKNATNRE